MRGLVVIVGEDIQDGAARGRGATLTAMVVVVVVRMVVREVGIVAGRRGGGSSGSGCAGRGTGGGSAGGGR